MGQKSKAKKLTDAICRDLPRLDKKYYKPGDYPGLQFWVRTSGTKTWYYQYRTKHKKFPQRKKIGNYPVVGVVIADNSEIFLVAIYCIVQVVEGSVVSCQSPVDISVESSCCIG